MIDFHPACTLRPSLDESPQRSRDEPPSGSQIPEERHRELQNEQSNKPPNHPEREESNQASDQSEDLPLDQVFEILKNSRRRETLRYLNENDGQTTLSELAEHIAALENETTIREITSAQRKRVYVGLYQCHLPKMDDTDVIEYDQNRGTIELGPHAAELDEYIEDHADRAWYKLYLNVALGAGLLFVASQAGAASVGLTPTVVLLLLFVGITATAVVHSVSATDEKRR